MRASAQATRRILALPELDVDVVNCFVSFRREIETRPLIEALLASGRTVGVPRIEPHGLGCRRIRSVDDLVPGFYDVPTSDGESLTEIGVHDGRAANREAVRAAALGDQLRRQL